MPVANSYSPWRSKDFRAKVKRRFYLMLWLILFLVHGILQGSIQAAENNRFIINIWQNEKGLPQNTVTGIAQTPDGYLWISTLDGLVRFDGSVFKTYRAGDTPELGTGRIRFMFSGKDGTLWFSTQEGGLIHLIQGHFLPLPLPEFRGLRPATTQLAEDGAGTLWFSTEDGSVYNWERGQAKLISTNWCSRDTNTIQLRADGQGQVWAANDQGLYRVSNNGLSSIKKSDSSNFRLFCPSRNGGWWLQNGTKIGLWRENRWRYLFDSPVGTNILLGCGLEDHTGCLWLGSSGAGVFRWNAEGNRIQLTRTNGLSSDLIRAICEDTEGNIWLGTEGGGLDRLHMPLFSVYGTAQGFVSDRITGVSEGPGGILWIAMDNFGVSRFENDSASLVVSGKSMPRIASVLADHRGRVWIGTHHEGVFRLENGELQPFATNSAGGKTTRCLFEDKNNDVWIGQYNTTNLIRVHNDDVSIIPLPKTSPPVDIRVMAEEASGVLWIGTDGSGLFRLQNNQFTHFDHENGLGSDFVWWLHPTPNGKLWIGTYGGGLTRLSNGRFITCNSAHGLTDDVICTIADDGRGQFWFSSNRGIFRVAKAELEEFAQGRISRIHCVSYGKSDGLPTLECEGGSQSSGCRTLDGRLWFSTIRGLVSVNPKDATDITPLPPVHIETLLVDGRSPADSEATSTSDSQKILKIPAGSTRYEFHYSAPCFGAPEGLRFRHQLEGVDAEWVETGTQRMASYNRLPSGDYTFRVQTCSREGFWNPQAASLTFTVSPFFWQTGWFIGLFLLTFGGAVGWIVSAALRRRHSHREQLLRHLNELERDRARIARDIHDDLGSSLTEITLLGALAVRETTKPAEARDQVLRIMNRAEDLARKLDETVWAVNPKNDSLRHLTTYLCQFAREFLDPTSIRFRLEISDEIPDAPLTAEIRHHIYLVTKEAFHNIVQHSKATEARLQINVVNNTFVIEIHDNGNGFDLEHPREGGNGLRNMKSRMNEIGGEFIVQSASGKGTTAILKLPLPISSPKE